MFQFEYLNKQKMKNQDLFQELFSEFIKELPNEFNYGLEIRNPNYINRSYFEFITENSIVPVLLQGYYMPSVVEVYNKWKDRILNQKTLVVRLHGSERDNIEKQTQKKWNKIVNPLDEELKEVAEILREMLMRGADIYLNVNNHYEGSAPLTIKRIQEYL